MAGLQARTFKVKGNEIRIAYPPELFEPWNIPNILSSVAGNVFGLENYAGDHEEPGKALETWSGS